MKKIVPRWEWRTFGDDLQEYYQRFRDSEEIRSVNSLEKYIISRKSDNNVKIRNEALDIKIPLRFDRRSRLEQWTVFMKEKFPLSLADLARFYLSAGIKLTYKDDDEFSLKSFLNNIVEKEEELLLVELEKERRIYNVQDVSVEFSRLRFAGYNLETIAIEDADDMKVVNLRQELGMEDIENINYIKAIKRHLFSC